MRPYEYCKVLGPYNSGTSLMERYVSRLFIVSDSEQSRVWKHSVPPYFHTNQTPSDPVSDILNSDSGNSESMFICMVRLPYFWLLSTLRRPYGLQFHTTAKDFSMRLRSPVKIKGRVYRNPVQLWNHYYHQYAIHSQNKDRVVYVKLEDLVLQTERTLTALETWLERRPGKNLNKVISNISSKPTKPGNIFGQEWKKKYQTAHLTELISTGDLAFINGQLEMDLLQKFNYQAIWARPEIR